MGLLRSAVVLGAIVALLPSDKAQQARIFETAGNAAHWTLTFCSRNAEACERGGELWTAFRGKAEFAAHIAYDVASQALVNASKDADTPGAAMPAKASLDGSSRSPDHGTLTGRDLEPAWRGKRQGV